MRTIYKYPMPAHLSVFEMPAGAKILHVAEQDEKLCLWAEVQTGNSTEKRQFIAHGTGHQMMDHPLQHIGTVLVDKGALVWHVYELLPA